MGSKTYSNDIAGNRTGKTDMDAWSYIYDGENRLTQVTKNGVDLFDNSYDASGMRIKDVKNGQTTYYVYQGNNPLMEYSLSDSKYKYFIFAGIKMIAEEKDGMVNYYHTDHLGSTRLVTDAVGNKVAEYKFKPYGETDSSSGTFSTNYQFSGKPVNADVGLSYFGGRFYDPEVGRFITQDPGRQGLNWYTYCFNNPVTNIDPDGRFAFAIPVAYWAGSTLVTCYLANAPTINRVVATGIEVFVKAAQAGESTTKTKTKRPPTKKSREKWEKETGEKWPTDPKTGTSRCFSRETLNRWWEGYSR
jgi:RHS repeat-associated protein